MVYRCLEAAEKIVETSKKYAVFEDLLDLSKTSKAVQKDDVERSNC